MAGWVKAVRKSGKKVRMGECEAPCVQVPSKTPGVLAVFLSSVLSLRPPVPRLLFDGWSYQDYMAVLSSEDEIEELASELVDVAKVTERRMSMPL